MLLHPVKFFSVGEPGFEPGLRAPKARVLAVTQFPEYLTGQEAYVLPVYDGPFALVPF